jgi:hypothetical protein
MEERLGGGENVSIWRDACADRDAPSISYRCITARVPKSTPQGIKANIRQKAARIKAIPYFRILIFHSDRDDTHYYERSGLEKP